ncbi:MAG: PIN domain-containing protein [Acidobacteria bacterium]|nr:PIN domain-containing protein [Acidobacteriota bacterium]
MSRVFWDTMLFIYLLEGHPQYAKKCKDLMVRSYERGDQLFTSNLALGEMLAGRWQEGREATHAMRAQVSALGFQFLPFDENAVDTFSQLRAMQKLKIADAIHLSCAASARVDLFLTGDKQLHRIYVPGVQFITNFESAPI